MNGMRADKALPFSFLRVYCCGNAAVGFAETIFDELGLTIVNRFNGVKLGNLNAFIIEIEVNEGREPELRKKIMKELRKYRTIWTIAVDYFDWTEIYILPKFRDKNKFVNEH